jgi:hypothetical protein
LSLVPQRAREITRFGKQLNHQILRVVVFGYAATRKAFTGSSLLVILLAIPEVKCRRYEEKIAQAQALGT